MSKELYMDVEESAILEGYRCRDDKCNGFLLRDSGMLKNCQVNDNPLLTVHLLLLYI